MRPLVVVSVGKLNFPVDVAESLESLADIVYSSSDNDLKYLKMARALVIGVGMISEDYLSKAPELGLLARFGVGYDNVEVKACTRRKIYVTHTPEVLSAGVADHTWALILSYLHWIPRADRYVREQWAKGMERIPFGWELAGKTLGILGLGRIGIEVVKRSLGFEVDVIYHDVVRKHDVEKEYGAKFVEFEKLLMESDILSIHVPLLPRTRGIIGEKELEIMKETAILVNTSRGSVLNESALIEALKEGKIAGAALDVFEEEPTPLTNPLLHMENVVLTPHLGSAMWETRRKMAESCAQSIREFLMGGKPTFVVPEQRNIFF